MAFNRNSYRYSSLPLFWRLRLVSSCCIAKYRFTSVEQAVAVFTQATGRKADGLRAAKRARGLLGSTFRVNQRILVFTAEGKKGRNICLTPDVGGFLRHA